MQEEESYSYRKMQDCDSYGRQPDQEEERGQEGCTLRLIIFEPLTVDYSVYLNITLVVYKRVERFGLLLC